MGRSVDFSGDETDIVKMMTTFSALTIYADYSMTFGNLFSFIFKASVAISLVENGLTALLMIYLEFARNGMIHR